MSKKQKGYKKIGTKNGQNIYETTIEVGYDFNGERKRIKRRHTGNNDSAEIWYAELVKKYYHKGKKVNINDLTFEEFSVQFLEYHKKNGIGKRTLQNYEYYLKDINPIIGDVKLKKVEPFMLDTMYQKIKKGKTGKELSPKTMSHYYSLVNLMLAQAKKWKFIEENPNEDTTKPKVPKKTKRFYNIEQTELFFKCLEKESIKYRTILVLTLVSGIRRSELCALRWSDIDFENNTILVDNSLKVINGEVDEEKAKTDYSVRTITINPKTMALLKEYQQWQNEYIIKRGDKWHGTDRVFTSVTGEHMHPDTCSDICKKVIDKYELPKITFHELRHTCSSILNGVGVDPVTIKERMGHSSVNITMDIYTHALESNKKSSCNIFEEIQEITQKNDLLPIMAQNNGTIS